MIIIDCHSRVPIYEQIKEQIIMLINTGVYQPDDRLPSIRNLSKELNINVNTIKHAFSDLEEHKVVYSVQGKGIFVSENPLGNKRLAESAIEEIRIAVLSGKAKGVSRACMEALIEEIYKGADTDD